MQEGARLRRTQLSVEGRKLRQGACRDHHLGLFWLLHGERGGQGQREGTGHWHKCPGRAREEGTGLWPPEWKEAWWAGAESREQEGRTRGPREAWAGRGPEVKGWQGPGGPCGGLAVSACSRRAGRQPASGRTVKQLVEKEWEARAGGQGCRCCTAQVTHVALTKFPHLPKSAL